MAELYAPLKPENAGAVVDLVLGPGGVGVSEQFYWPEVALRPEAEHQPGWGAWREGRLLAFVLWREMMGENEITVLATHPSGRRQGLMHWLLKSAFAAHPEKAWLLEVHEANAGALELYQSLGFHRVGMRKAYYRDGAAALVFRRSPEVVE